MFKILTVHGRFQPPLHINHWNYISKAFETAEKVIILITNPHLEETPVPEAEHRNKRENNPFTYEQRVEIFRSFFDIMGISKDRYELRPFDITDENTLDRLDKDVPNLVNVYSNWSKAKLEKFQSKGLETIKLEIPKVPEISGTKIRTIILKNIGSEEKVEELIGAGYMKEAIPGLLRVLGYNGQII